jgi:hypothetical protein
MDMSLGERARHTTARLAVCAFSTSLALLEAHRLRWLSRFRRRAQGPSAPNGGADRATVLPSSPAASVPQRAITGDALGVPIVFIHQGDSPHLVYALAQAAASNPSSRVILLGDDANNRHPLVEHHRFADYFVAAAAFGRVYQHYSTHPESFELICFQRWFVLNEFMTKQRIEQCVYLDSDVLLYADVTSDMKKFRLFDFTLCWNSIGCVCFVNRRQGLEQLCRFMTDAYTKKDPYTYDRMLAHFATRLKHDLKGGVCDMTALQMYNERHFGSIGEASHVIDGSVYDPNINVPQPGFEMENDVKKVIWQDGVPYGTFLATGERVRFNSLHFNGRAKALMPRYCTAHVS